jgi:hypothetical protein
MCTDRTAELVAQVADLEVIFRQQLTEELARSDELWFCVQRAEEFHPEAVRDALRDYWVCRGRAATAHDAAEYLCAVVASARRVD